MEIFKLSAVLFFLAAIIIPSSEEKGDKSTVELEPLVSVAEMKDGGAYGKVLSISSEFGNINTEFIDSDLKALGIEPESYFRMKYNKFSVKVFFGKNYSDVPNGDWVALWRDRRLRIARNSENAAQTLGCQEGDKLFIEAITN